MNALHHIAIIVKNENDLEFYKKLGFTEENRINRGYDQIVWLHGYGEKLEIFIDPTHPDHVTNPEAYGLRHLAFETDDVDAEWERLSQYNPEPIRVKDDGKKVFFVKDPARSIKGTTKLAKKIATDFFHSNRGNC